MFFGLQEIRIAFSSNLHLYHVVRYGFLTFPVVRLDMESTYQGTPQFDYLGYKSLLKHHRVSCFALLRPQSVSRGVSKYLSCICDQESTISSPCFQGPHKFLPRNKEIFGLSYIHGWFSFLIHTCRKGF